MFKWKEIASLAIAALTLGYLLSFIGISWISWLSMSGLAFIMLFVHHMGQKLSAWFYDCSAEIDLWTVKQIGFAKSHHFPFYFPMWLALPVLLIITTLGYAKWLAITIFDAAPLPSRIERRFTELTEWHLALIAVGGLMFNTILAIISSSLGFQQFAMLNLTFIIFNLIPFSTFDGNKIFFGSPMLWIFCLIFTVVMMLLIGSVSIAGTIAASVMTGLAAVLLYYSLYR